MNSTYVIINDQILSMVAFRCIKVICMCVFLMTVEDINLDNVIRSQIINRFSK